MRKFSQLPIFLVLAWMPIASATAGAQTNFGSVNIGSSVSSAVTVTIASAATVGSISVVTEGAAGLDFANAGTGSCTAGTSYTAGQTCTVEVTFKPVFSGARYGAALLKDGSGRVLATGYLVGKGLGPQVAYSPAAAVAIGPTVDGSPLNGPFGLMVDAAGDLLIADGTHQRIVQVPSGGGAPTAFDPIVNGKGLGNPGGLAVDAAGNLFISDLDHDVVIEVPAGGGAVTAIDPILNGIGLKYPCGLVFDAAGNLFIADVDNARVLELPASGGAASLVDGTVNGEPLSYPVTLALDGAGDLFIADEFNNRVVEVPSGGGAPTAIDPTVNGQSLNHPYGIAVDAAGDLFIVDSGNNRVVEVPAGGGAATVIDATVNGEGLNYPIGIALTGAGDLFISDLGHQRVVEVERSQPPGLSFAAASQGSTSSDSPQTVQVENIGNGALTFPIPSAGNNPSISANFTLDSSGASACPLLTPASSAPGILAAGASCALPVSFEPASAGSISGALTLADNNLNAAAPGYATQSISLSGDSPLASLSTSRLWFGAQALGTLSASQQVTLTNTGSASLSIASIGVTGANASSFAFPNPCGSSLAAGASCVIQGQFTPASVGALTAAITIADNAGGSPRTITLTGAGVYPSTVTVTPSSSSINTAQPLIVTVAVSGGSGNPAPTGSIWLMIGRYGSEPVPLSGGNATIGVPAGSLAAGTDNVVAIYTPDSLSSSIYETTSGSNSVIVDAVLAPAATTGAASEITANSVTLGGTVNPNGADTHYWFLYGTSNTLSGASQTPSVDLGPTTAVDPVTASISGLNASSTYYYQAVGQNSVGTTSGTIDSFTTPASPSFSISGMAVTIAPGAVTGNTATIIVTPANGLTGIVTLSAAVTNSPSGAVSLPTLSFGSVNTVDITGVSAGTAALTISTQAAIPGGCTTANSTNRKVPSYAEGSAVLVCVLLCWMPARRRRRLAMLGMAALLAALAGGVLACGGSRGSGCSAIAPPPATTTGTYTITVTGTSGSTMATGTVTLTVQ